MGLVSELKRRNVFRVALLYIVASWLILQVAEVLASLLPVPDWAGTFVLFLLLIAFPLVLIFSWVYEITPEGIKLEKEVERDRSITAHTGRKINLLTIVLAVAAIVVVGLDRMIPESQPVTPAAVAVTDTSAPAEAQAPSNSIAVLPFVDMSPGKDQEYLSDGLAEELLNLLARVPEIRVAARTSSFSFKHQDVDIAAVANKLNVAYVLEGSVRKSGDRVRVTAQLIDATNGYHVWSDKFDRALEDIFAIQDEIAGAVVETLKVTLLGERSRPREVDPEAYALFLQGRYFAERLSIENHRKAVESLNQALSIDPEYAPAWAELGRTYSNQAVARLVPVDEGFRLAREHLEKAISIDPEHAVAYSRLGWIALNYGSDLPEAAALMSKALALEPGNDTVLANAGSLAAALGRLDQAIELHEHALARDPLSPSLNLNTGLLYITARRPGDAETLTRRTLVLSPDHMGASAQLARILSMKEQPEAALEAAQQEPLERLRLAGTAITAMELGRTAVADDALQVLIEEHTPVAAPIIGTIYALRGETDPALEWFEKAYRMFGVRALLFTRDSPEVAILHDDPRWEAMLTEAGISEQQLAEIEFEVTLPE